MSYTYNKLIGRIIEKFGTRKKFAEAIHMSENSLSLKLNNKTGFSQEDIDLWAQLLDIDVAEYGSYFFT